MVVGAFGAEGSWFDSTSSCHVDTLGKSFSRRLVVVACIYDVMWRPVAALRLNSTPVIAYYHTLLVNILWCVRLYMKRKYYYSYLYA